jgi:hypothetical protein
VPHLVGSTMAHPSRIWFTKGTKAGDMPSIISFTQGSILKGCTAAQHSGEAPLMQGAAMTIKSMLAANSVH